MEHNCVNCGGPCDCGAASDFYCGECTVCLATFDDDYDDYAPRSYYNDDGEDENT